MESFRGKKLSALRCINCGGPRVHNVDTLVDRGVAYESNFCLVCDETLNDAQRTFIYSRIIRPGWQMPGPPELHSCSLESTTQTASICLIPHCFKFLPHPNSKTRPPDAVYSESKEVQHPSIDSLRLHRVLDAEPPTQLIRRMQLAEPGDRHFEVAHGHVMPTTARFAPTSPRLGEAALGPESFLQSQRATYVPELDDLNDSIVVDSAVEKETDNDARDVAESKTPVVNDSFDIAYLSSRPFLAMLSTHSIRLPVQNHHVLRLTWEQMRAPSMPRKPFVYETSHANDPCASCNGPLFSDDAFRRRYGLDLMPSADRKHLFICRVCQTLLSPATQTELLMNMASSNTDRGAKRQCDAGAALTGRINTDPTDDDLFDVPLVSASPSSSSSDHEPVRKSKPLMWCRALSDMFQRLAVAEKEEIEQQRDAQRADATRNDPLLQPPPRRLH